jgi:SLAP domain-containing protein
MSNIDIKISGNDTIIIINDMLQGAVTITTKDSNNEEEASGITYKVSPDGRLININEESDVDIKSIFKKPLQKASKEALTRELVEFGFDQIPDNIPESELADILSFSKIKIDKSMEYSKMFPFKVEITNIGDLKVTLLMYNGINDSISLSKFPFKLLDAKDNVLMVDMIDINKSINPFKIAICEVLIGNDRLNNQTPDLIKWTVTFELQ